MYDGSLHSNYNLTKIASSNGRYIALQYDASYDATNQLTAWQEVIVQLNPVPSGLRQRVAG
ncbi:MAG: hypothetical protein M3N93_03855, partial [Acidobacteriota bacterium]|nr:hypothetical protein [Acidobacteriota bacterium]